VPRQPLDDRIEKNRRDIQKIIDDINKSSIKSEGGSESTRTPTGSNSDEIANILNNYKTKKPLHSDEDTSASQLLSETPAYLRTGRRSPRPSDLADILKQYGPAFERSRDLDSALKEYEKKFEDRIKAHDRDMSDGDGKLKDLRTFRDDEGQMSATMYIPSGGLARGRRSPEAEGVATLPKLKKKASYESEYAPIKFTDRQVSIGSESRVYPHRGSRELDEDELREVGRPSGSPRSSSESAKYRMDGGKGSAIEVQLGGEYL